MGEHLMVWQQWVLLIWICLRIPFGIHREVTREHFGIPEDKQERSLVIGICTYLFIQAVILTLVVTI